MTLAAITLAAYPLCAAPLPAIRVAPDGRGFVTSDGKPFIPWGVNYYRPGTGWAPQLWKKFDAAATRQNFARLKAHGVNCIRVFLTYGSFYQEKGRLSSEGLERLDQLLALGEEFGIYIHPTGPDHWEGLPAWAAKDRMASEEVLSALEEFWRLMAARYKGRGVIFAYDLLNEPEMPWDSPALKERYARWVKEQYGTPEKAAQAWGLPENTFQGGLRPPEPKDKPRDPWLLDYQKFRESVADEWTRRQVAAIKSADPNALVTVGLIQWSIPAVLPSLRHYSAFKPARQAPMLDFLEFHFYPLAQGAYEYRSAEDEWRNLAYAECLAREVSKAGKPVVLAEMGWYGGDKKPRFGGGRHPQADEEQQARWCRRLVQTTAGFVTGWLNWGFYDQPEATDVSEQTGLMTAQGETKAWGREFHRLSRRLEGQSIPLRTLPPRPEMDWDLLLTSQAAAREFMEQYYKAFRENPSPTPALVE